MTDRVGVRDLKASLSAHLRRVSAGESILVTDHGRVVARLVPPDVPEGLSGLIRSGRLNWAARRLTVPPKRPALRGKGPGLADIVRRDRG
jgi:prevent-host-death family protein